MIGLVQKKYVEDLAKTGEELDPMDMWLYVEEKYLEFLDMYLNKSQDESMNILDLVSNFSNIDNLKMFISDIIFVFSKIIVDLKDTFKYIEENKHDEMDMYIYNLIEKNIKSIPVILRYHIELMSLIDKNETEELRLITNRNNDKYKEMNRSFRDFSELFIKVNGDHMSIKRDYKSICSSIEKVYQEINIYNMQKYLDDKVVELSVLRTGYMKKVKEWLADNTVDLKTDTDIVVEIYGEGVKKMKEMKEKLEGIFLNNNEIIGDDEEKDSKYVRICNIIGEKYNNDVIKFMREEEYDKKIYNYGRRKNFYKSITIHLNRCNIFLKEISEIKEKWI